MSKHTLLFWGYTPGDTESIRIGMESGEKLQQMFGVGGQKYKFCGEKLEINVWDKPSETGDGVSFLILYAEPLTPNANNTGGATLCLKQLRQAAIADGWTDDSTIANLPRENIRNRQIQFANTATQREYNEEHTPLVVHVAPTLRVPTKSGGAKKKYKRRTVRRHRSRLSHKRK